MPEDLQKAPWKILVADDDEEVQKVTSFVLQDFEFMGRGVEIFHAYSAEEGLAIAEEHPDIAVALVDVVMETEFAGLEMIKQIREELENKLMRIILRTGQPGVAPEKDVVIKYDINDYREKTELTFQKLQSSLITALRSHVDLLTIENGRLGLKKIIEISATLFNLQGTKNFAACLLEQVVSLLKFNSQTLSGQISSFAAGAGLGDPFVITAATGDYQQHLAKNIDQLTDPVIIQDIADAKRLKAGFKKEDRMMFFFQTANGEAMIIYIRGVGEFSANERRLLDVFRSNISIAFDNLSLKNEIMATQKELMLSLGEAIEIRSVETGQHLSRVSKLSLFIAEKLGLAERESEKLALISTMHDVGKITIPDDILNKPGRLSDEEYEIMKTHAYHGYKLLSKSRHELMTDAAIIALQHHERHDGLGYPSGLKGDEIHIFARIVGLVDVYDALLSARAYKPSWTREAILNYISSHSGKRFDPQIVDVFVENFAAIWQISN